VTSEPAAFPRTVHADRGDAGHRLDHVLLRHLAGIPWASRTKIQRWIVDGVILVNGKQRDVADRVAYGDEILIGTLPSPEPPKPELVAEEIPLSILFEDEHLLVVDKPPGLVVHPAVGHRSGTLVNALLHHAKEWGGDPERPGLVHRLDKDTSGVLVVAKTETSHASIAKAMKARTLEKEYWAVVYGKAPVQKGKIDLKIHRDRADRKKMTTSKTEGRESTTLYERLGESAGEKAGLSLLKCLLLTGRTHQIRVHLKAINLPIVGDATYGAARWKGIKDPDLAAACRDFPRQALHARRLALTHPATRQRMEFVAPVPADIAGLLRAAGMG
jgi:23S rRNA pseudouridine1911/1915/1917 synthase